VSAPGREATDALFRRAVALMDRGDVAALERLLADHPELVRVRLAAAGPWLRAVVKGALDGFFKDPYLLWFVAEDPVRNGTLPQNIADVARAIVEAITREGVDNRQEQLDYALNLVAWSWIARDSQMQIPLIDVLVDAGATLDGNPENALVNSNFDAAEYFVTRGARLTLATALCLGWWDDATRLAQSAPARERQFAFTLCALKGKAEALRRLIDLGVDVNGVSADLYSHATALHHAVSSGSLDAVKVVVQAGANLSVRDTAYGGTPLGWAEHSKGEPQYDAIAGYLLEKRAPR
jgi:peptide-methionine (S)-S-oxide reductase